VVAHEGAWENYQPPIPPDHAGDLALMLLYLRDHADDALRAKLGDEWDELEKVEADVCRIVLRPASAGDAPEKVLATAMSVAALTPSPDGRAIAYFGQPVEKALAAPALVVVPVTGEPQRIVAERASAWPAWSADGRSIFYAAADATPEDNDQYRLCLGKICRAMIFEEDDRLVTNTAGEFGTETLASALVCQGTCLACLPSGDVLFSTKAAALPAPDGGKSSPNALYRLVPSDSPADKPSVVEPLAGTMGQGLGQDIGYFTVSPDGKRAAVLSGAGLSVVDIATGEVVSVCDNLAEPAPALVVPAWRSNADLSFAAGADAPFCHTGKPEVVLVTVSDKEVTGSKCLSAEWAEDARLGLLEKQQEEQQAPTTEPASGPE
jgi:hypothetical protein